MRHLVTLACLAAAALSTTACSSRQAYDAAQAWRRNECGQILDMQERQRCTGAASTSYDRYQRQRQDIQP
ncbi:MAG: hypothetical protein ACN6O8_04340 [Achromobacter sp.]|uniref:hypothetical protein n=1 Tax=Achromobacter sp. TaxID=134375 RepID=UPI003D0746F4